jgi:hypothetical protein
MAAHAREAAPGAVISTEAWPVSPDKSKGCATIVSGDLWTDFPTRTVDRDLLDAKTDRIDTKLTKFEEREIDKRLQLEVRVSAPRHQQKNRRLTALNLGITTYVNCATSILLRLLNDPRAMPQVHNAPRFSFGEVEAPISQGRARNPSAPTKWKSGPTGISTLGGVGGWTLILGTAKEAPNQTEHIQNESQ